MNKTFHSVWNAAKQAYVAAAETVSAKGKPSSGTKVAAVVAAMLGGGLTGAQAQQAPPPNTLPTGGQVSAGQARIGQSGAHMVIQQASERAAINWQSFNVGRDATVQFQQPSAASVALNRVMSNDPSQIFGRITANGQVILSNPSGVFFGRDSRVDVGGLIATTKSISDADFMAGKNRFERNGSTASVVNEGELKAALGGYIALLAPEVRNEGAIIAHMGTVALASGEAVDLKFDSNNRLTSIRVEPSQIKALVDNRRAVQAPGGLIILSAQSMDRLVGGVVKNSGRLEASGMLQQGGRIILSASRRIDNSGTIAANATAGEQGGPAGKIELNAPEVVNSGSITATGTTSGTGAHSGGTVQVQATQFTQSATGAIDLSAPSQGGALSIQATGEVQLQGRVNVSATQDSTALGTASQGGEIHIEAQGNIEVTDASLDASGGQGGRIALRAASEQQPTNPQPQPDVPGQGRLAIMGHSTLSSRGRRGQGGSTSLLGDHIELLDTTHIDASGATGGGTVLVGGDWQGGKGVYQASTVRMGQGVGIDASANEKGDGGTVVLWSDAHRAGTVTRVAGRISARGGALGGDGGRVETSGHELHVEGARVDAGAPQGLGGLWYLDPTDATITQAVADSYQATLNTGTSVLNDVVGTITWDSGVTLSKTAGGNATLTLRSASNGAITLNSPSISSSSGALNLVLWTRYNTEGSSGKISITGGTISTNGGHVWMGGGNADTPAWNGLTVGRGVAATYTAGAQGLFIGTTSISTGVGNIKLAGLSDVTSGASDFNYGVWIDRGSSIQTTSGSITIEGSLNGTYRTAVAALIGSTSNSLVASGNVTLQTGTGAINLTGTGQDRAAGSTGYRHGLVLQSNGTDLISVSSNSGAITLTGSASFSYSSNDVSGIQLQNNSTTSTIEVVSRSGAISFLGSTTNEGLGQYTNAIRFTAANAADSIRIGYDGTNAYSGNILIQGNSLLQRTNQSGAGSISLQTTGTLTLQSAGSTFTYLRAGNAGTLTFDDDWNFGTTLGGFTIGKSGNTLNLTLSNALSVAGSVSLYGGDRRCPLHG